APRVAANLGTGHRYNAARAAARAGCDSADPAQLSAEERARWRQQARVWLRADLAAWADRLTSNTAAARAQVRQTLAQWPEEPNLAGLRDPDALDQLAADERKECLALWAEVAAMLARTEK